MRLPNLGRTISHSMTPSVARINTNLGKTDLEDSKLIEQVAKHAFLKMDEKTIEAFRNNQDKSYKPVR